MKHLHIFLFVLFGLSACTPAVPTTAVVPAEVMNTPTAIAAVTTAPTQATASLNRIEIPAPSLANNLVGEPTERTISVYLPPSYASSEKRYPVIYYLPGYGDSDLISFRLPGDMDSLIKSGQVNEM